jgi:hypothetical protein
LTTLPLVSLGCVKFFPPLYNHTFIH